MIWLVWLLMCSILLPSRRDGNLQDIQEGQWLIGDHKLSLRLQLIGSFIGATGGGPPTCKIHCRLEFKSPSAVSLEILPESRKLHRIFCHRFRYTVLSGETHPQIDLIMNQVGTIAKGRGLCGKPGCLRITNHGIFYTEGPYVYHSPFRGSLSKFQMEILQLANTICSSTRSEIRLIHSEDKET